MTDLAQRKEDGLHCVHGRCIGPPNGPMQMCNPGCYFQMSALPHPLLPAPPKQATEAAARIAELEREVEEQTLARGRLRLWLEFIHSNCNSPEAKEFAGEALNGAHVPEGFSDE